MICTGKVLLVAQAESENVGSHTSPCRLAATGAVDDILSAAIAIVWSEINSIVCELFVDIEIHPTC